MYKTANLSTPGHCSINCIDSVRVIMVLSWFLVAGHGRGRYHGSESEG